MSIRGTYSATRGGKSVLLLGNLVRHSRQINRFLDFSRIINELLYQHQYTPFYHIALRTLTHYLLENSLPLIQPKNLRSGKFTESLKNS
jgi:hypothetical protein